MLSNCVLSVAIVAVLCECVRAQTPASRVVQLKQGPVRGYLDSQEGVYKFYNIPFATAPTGRDRYKAPLPPPTWTTVREAVDRGIICHQSPVPDKTTTLDCLIVNVHVPDTQATNLPVLVMIHGGGFQGGHGDPNAYRELLHTKKVIVVAFNYRLGAPGFLCLGTQLAPGNAGLKDQVAALRWIRDNIASFGGNPNDVTIDGCSAGGAAVDLLLLSKSAKGLFHKAMAGSGANLNVWSVQLDPLQNAKDFAKSHNFTNVDNIEALEEFYVTIPLEKLVNSVGFVPCIERNIGEEVFLDEAPMSILEKRDFIIVPMLYGYAELEGYTMVVVMFEWFKFVMNLNFANVLPSDLQFQSEAERYAVGQRVKELYFGNRTVSDDTIMEYMDYFTDIMFAYAMLRAAKLQVEAGNNQVYLYEYSFAEGNLFLPENINATVSGAIHCEQSIVMFGNLTGTVSANYHQMSTYLQEIWLNFVTTGAPVTPGSSLPAWPPINAERSPYMDLNLPLRLHGPLHPKRAQLWDEIYGKHYKKPIPPNPPLSSTIAPPSSTVVPSTVDPPQPGSASAIDKNLKLFTIVLITVLLGL